MAITFICGGASVGKTKHLHEGIIKIAQEQPEKNIILIVPEQFNMQTQMDIVSQHKAHGIMNIEVLSFARLAYRVFEEVGRALQKTLEDTGKSMVLKKMVMENQKELKYFGTMSDKYGFIDRLKTLIQEFHQYEISQEDLVKWQDDDEFHPILKEKLHDLGILYEAYHDYVSEDYMTSEGTLDELKDTLPQSELLKNSVVVFDGFYGFTPQQYSIMGILMTMADHLLYTLTVDDLSYLKKPLDDQHIFFGTKETFTKICLLANDKGVHINKPRLLSSREGGSEDLMHLCKNLFRYPYSKYNEPVKHLKITASVNPIKEVEYVCKKIYELLHTGGYDYRDIAILTTDLAGYEPLLEREFQLYNIPYFIDSKREIYGNPLIEIVRRVLEVHVKGFTYESVMGLIKTQFIKFPSWQHMDLLENYLLEKNIHGKKVWIEEEWISSEQLQKMEPQQQARMEKILEGRRIVIESLESFTKVMSKKKKTAEEMTVGLYDFLIHLQCPTQLKNMQVGFEKQGQFNKAHEYSQIWKKVMELLDQVVTVLGNEYMSGKEYASLIEAGLEQCKIGLVPPSLNQILVGDLERTRLHDLKALFTMGFNDGLVPVAAPEKGLFTEEDRGVINSGEKSIAKSNKAKMNEEYFLVYNALSKPSEYLYMSYALSTVEGKPLSESFILKQIQKIFPQLEFQYQDQFQWDIKDITMPEPTLFKYIEEQRRGGSLPPLWQAVENWYEKHPRWHKTFELITEGFAHHNQVDNLSPKVVNELYGKVLHGSVSKLESYAACPFSYFIRYGLKAEERKLSDIKAPHVGMFFHLLLEVFATRAKQQGLSWDQLSGEQRDALLEECMEKAMPMLKMHNFMATNRSKYMVHRLKRITRTALSMLQEHLKHGDFIPKDFELDFGGEGKLPAIKFELSEGKEMQLTGKIDRVDLLEEEDCYYAKIIDYKTGNKKFDLVAIYNGLQLQLIVYLDALTQLGPTYLDKPLRPAGLFYFKVDDPIVSNLGNLSMEELGDQLFGEMKMSGLVLSDGDIIEKLDKEFTDQSKIIPVKKNKNGSLSKSSSVADEQGFKDLQAYVRKKSIALGESILQGNVRIEPYKKTTETACDYCEYKAICQFDERFVDNEYCNLEDVKKDFWDKIKEES